MGRQDNVEIFEDTQRLCSSNERLISAIKNSSAGQQCFSDKGRHWYGAGYRIYQQPAKVIGAPNALWKQRHLTHMPERKCAF